jgi:endonuclease G, mitochondrial
MELKCLLLSAGSFVAGVAAQYVFSTYLWPNRYKTYTWVYTFRNHRKYGEPCKTDLVLDRDGYSLGYSYKYKSALWVSYIISKGSIGVDVDRSDEFFADPAIPEKYRVQPEDFSNTGYDRGHLAPSAAIDFSRIANQQTFAMSNVAFQDPKLNRQAWGSLEKMVRGWTQTKGKIYVITGPLFDEKPKRINDVPVPHSFYKIIYAIEHDRCIGFIFPNENIKAAQLWNYAMSVKDLEKETDYKFFPKLGRARKLKSELTVSWWRNK